MSVPYRTSASPAGRGGGTTRAFALGLVLPFRGAAFLGRRPALWLAVLTPLALNAALFAALFVWAWGNWGEAVREWTGAHSGWTWTALAGLAKVGFVAAVLIPVYFLFIPMALLIAAPFNDWIAYRAEQACGLAPAGGGEPAWRALAGDALFALRSESKRLLICGAGFLLLFALNVLPVAGNLLWAAGSAYWVVWCAAFEFFSYAADRRRVLWAAKRRILHANRPLALGFGAAAVALLAIPFVNVLAVPVCAAGGAMLFAECRKDLRDFDAISAKSG